MIFLLKIILKIASKSYFFRFGVEIRLWSVSADRIVMAASRLLGTAAACVILLSFAAGHRKSYWSGCIKAAILICQQIFSILARIIFLLKIILKIASKSYFFRFGVEIRLWSVSADRIVMAASRLLGTAAACVILLSFAAGHRKSYWSGCIKAAMLICQQIFSILARIIFLLKIILKIASKSSFFRFGVEIRLWSVSADRIVMAASRLLGTAAACVILLSFAAGHRKSYWSGCIKAAILICQQIFSILARILFLLKIILKSASKSYFFRFGVEIHPVLELQFLL